MICIVVLCAYGFIVDLEVGLLLLESIFYRLPYLLGGNNFVDLLRAYEACNRKLSLYFDKWSVLLFLCLCL